DSGRRPAGRTQMGAGATVAAATDKAPGAPSPHAAAASGAISSAASKPATMMRASRAWRACIMVGFLLVCLRLKVSARSGTHLYTQVMALRTHHSDELAGC